MTQHPKSWRLLITGLCVCAATSCTTESATPRLPSESPRIEPPPSTVETMGSSEAEVRALYERFWRITQAAGAHTGGDQLDLVATPQWSAHLRARLAEQHEHGVVLYGHVHPHVTRIDIDGDRARLTDCQDASHAGRADAATRRPRTVGIPRNPVVASLIRLPDGWRVAAIDYPGGTC